MNYDLILKISGTYDKYWREIITSALITIVGRIPLEYVKRYYRKTILYRSMDAIFFGSSFNLGQ